MNYDERPIDDFELNIRATNIIRRWKNDATLGDVRKAFTSNDSTLLQMLRVRDRKEIEEVLANCVNSPAELGIFDHITADLVRAERERTGEGMAVCKRELQRVALLSHIENADVLDMRTVLRWLVERAR